MAGKPRVFILVVYSSLKSKSNIFFFGGAVLTCRRIEREAKCFINTISPVSGYDPFSTQPHISAGRGRTYIPLSLFPSSVDRTVFSFAHVFKIHSRTHTQKSPSMLTPIMSRTASPVKPSQPSRHNCPLVLCAPTLASHCGWSVSSSKLVDLSQLLAQAWHLVGV